MNRYSFAHRALALLFSALLALSPALSLAEGEAVQPDETEVVSETAEAGESAATTDEAAADATGGADENAVKYIANASVGLKLRKTPEAISNGIGSIKKDATVYIIDLGPEWSKVRERNIGYVQTQYLINIREYDESTEQAGEVVEKPVFDTDGSTDDNGFINNFYAYSVKATALYEEPNADARRKASIPIYRKVFVSENSGGWSYCKYEGYYGYIPTDDLFKWDRVNAYAGDIPGLIIYQHVAFINKPTNVYSYETNKALNDYPINAGSAICVMSVDAQGRYETMYHRERAYINADDVASTMPVVPWAGAQPGDLISVMTTFFGVGVSTLNYQGRNWNIYLAGSKITGTVLEAGDDYNMNKTIGPYSKSTGYKSAPIMSPRKLTGYGGGTCQVNTTFYITTIAVPLLVTHRRVHANVGMYYCLKGFDAAVGGGEINLEMTNTLPYAVRYQYMISDGVMTCCIFRDH